MANHKSAVKRIRKTKTRKAKNSYFEKTARNAIKKLRNTTNKKDALELLPKIESMLDKLAKKNVIHKNKSANLKSGLIKHINSLK